MAINQTMANRFSTADKTEISELVRSIKQLWENMGMPEPDQTTTTGTSGNRYMVEYNNIEDKPLVDRYNHLVDLLWDLVDEFHIGSGIWYTHYYSSDEWNQYTEKASELIEDFIDNNLWDSVCKNWEDKE